MPKNSQEVKNFEVLRPQKGFEKPEFYQSPSWKFVRISTNQNSKQKYYDKGDYDTVQYSFPGVDENVESEMDGEQKLYPPIDLSDEEAGLPPVDMQAKISFGKSPDRNLEPGALLSSDGKSSKMRKASTQAKG